MRVGSLAAVAAISATVGLLACGDAEEEGVDSGALDSGTGGENAGGGNGGGVQSGGAGGDTASGGAGGEGLASGTGGDIASGGVGGDGPVGGAGGGDFGGCVAVQLATSVINGFNELGGVTYEVEVSPNIFGAKSDYLRLSIYDFDAGDFDLGSTVNRNPAECKHCNLLFVDLLDGKYDKLFWQESGTFRVQPTHHLEEGAIDATLDSVKMIEVQATSSGLVPVKNGECLWIANEQIRIDPVPGWTCFPVYHNDGYCDCECGIWEADCDVPGKAWGCAPGATCEKVDGAGVCQGGATGWSCDEAWYNDGMCDCSCTAWDVDCDVDPRDVLWCDPGEVCLKVDGDAVCG